MVNRGWSYCKFCLVSGLIIRTCTYKLVWCPKYGEVTYHKWVKTEWCITVAKSVIQWYQKSFPVNLILGLQPALLKGTDKLSTEWQGRSATDSHPLRTRTVNLLYQYCHTSHSHQMLWLSLHAGNRPCITPTCHPWNEAGGWDPTQTVWISFIQQTKP